MGPAAAVATADTADTAGTAAEPTGSAGQHDPGAPKADGRRVRGERTRRLLALALVDLLETGHPRPTARQIAEEAGVSLRIVFHHFDDVEAVFAAAASLQRQRHWSAVRPVDPAASTPERVSAVAAQLVALYEGIGPVRRAAAAQEATCGVIASELERSRRMLRSYLEASFRPELSECSPSSRRRLLDGLDICCSWETWEQLRGRLGRSRRLATDVLKCLMTAQLGSRQRDPSLEG